MTTLIDPPDHLLATEYRGEMNQGETRPLLVVAYTSDWTESRELVVKLRNPGVEGLDDGGTLLACELICSILARELGFLAPNYCLVEITDELVESIDDDDARSRLEQNLGLNFGVAYLTSVDTWRCRRRPLPTPLRDMLAELMEYDSAILNGDRTADNSNLLWDGKRCYPIDHGLALSVYQQSEQAYEAFLKNPFLLDEEIQQHTCFSLLAWQSLNFESLGEKWNNLPMKSILREIESLVPDSWESTAGDLDRIFDFLQQRSQDFEAITDQLRRVVV